MIFTLHNSAKGDELLSLLATDDPPAQKLANASQKTVGVHPTSKAIAQQVKKLREKKSQQDKGHYGLKMVVVGSFLVLQKLVK